MVVAGWEAILLALVVGGLAGFAWGRRRGIAQGFQQGLAYAPLKLRHESWLLGRCLMCNSGPGEQEGVDRPGPSEYNREYKVGNTDS